MKKEEKPIFRCEKCNKIFFHLDSVSESRGEWFGFPSYEEVAVSPCCHRSFYELDEEEISELRKEELSKAKENESYYSEQKEMEAIYESYLYQDYGKIIF